MKISDERIHRHEWENGRCSFCGISKQTDEKELLQPSSVPLSRELGDRLDKIDRNIARVEAGLHLGLCALVVIAVFIFLVRGH